MSNKVEMIEKKDPIVQLGTSKLSIKDLFSNLLKQTKCFKYQITIKILLKEYKLNGEIEFAPVSFNSTTKTVIRHKFSLKNTFQEILYMTEPGLMKDIAELLNQSSLNTLTFQLIDYYQEVLT